MYVCESVCACACESECKGERKRKWFLMGDISFTKLGSNQNLFNYCGVNLLVYLHK